MAEKSLQEQHIPVMRSRVLEMFTPALNVSDPLLIDGTLGLAGHTESLLKEFPNLKIIGIDRDPIAIERANLTKDDIDFIVFATLSPDMYFPGGGVRVQDMLEMPTIGALDVRNQCSGFVYALSVADQFIKTGMYKNILEYYPNELYADDAQFKLGELYEYYLSDKEKAKQIYQELLLNFSGSTYAVDARKRYRELRGDAPTN